MRPILQFLEPALGVSRNNYINSQTAHITVTHAITLSLYNLYCKTHMTSPVDKVSKIVQQFSIVLEHQVFPAECTVLYYQHGSI